MKKSGRLNATVVASLLVVVLALPAVAGDMTVGSFVQRLAQEKKLDATDARTAVHSLAAAGVRLPADLPLDGRLTEGDVVRVSRSAGLHVTTASPSAYFDAARVDLFFDTFAYDLGPGRGTDDRTTGSGDQRSFDDRSGPPFNPFGKGKGLGGTKGKGKGPNFTPTD